MARIALITFGTRGDVQPFLALALRLQTRGHDVCLAAPDDFRSSIERRGLPFVGMGTDFRAFLQTPEARALLAGRWWRLPRLWRSTILPMVEAALEGTRRAASDAEIIIAHPKAIGAADVAEASGARLFWGSTLPMIPTSEFPAVVFSRSLGPFLNRLSHRLFDLSRTPYRGLLNRWRRRALGLGPGSAFGPLDRLGSRTVPVLCAVSEAVLPRPRDWPSHASLTGYWFLDGGTAWKPSVELDAFLEAGPPPVYVGFGSMPTSDPSRTATTVARAVERSGVRAVVAGGWGGLVPSRGSDALFFIEGAPHEALFPRMAAVVHHGGAGTVAAGLRAGRPTLVCPAGVDQPFWGARVQALGCGPKPLALRALTPERLAGRLEDLTGKESYGVRAREIADRIGAEDGLGRAIEVVER